MVRNVASIRRFLARVSVASVLACGGSEPGNHETTTAGTAATTDPTTTTATTSTDTPTSTTTGDDPSTTAATTVDPTTGEPTGDVTGDDPSPGCVPSEVPGGTLRWALGAGALPGPGIQSVAGSPNGDTVVVGARDLYTPMADAFVHVVDAAGQSRWSDLYTGKAGLADYALGVAVDGEGFIHVLVRETILQVQGDEETTDARLVVLRYAPDGARVWRWERAHPPVMPGETFTPIGQIAVVDDDLALLEQIAGEPPRLVRLDRFGAVLSEVVFADLPPLSTGSATIGRTGVHFVGKTEGALDMWVARYSFAAEQVWSDQFATDEFPYALVGGPDGATWIAWVLSQEWYPQYTLRRYEQGGAVAFTRDLDFGDFPGTVMASGLHCDGTLLLAGGVYGVAEPKDLLSDRKDVWTARHDADGAHLWTHAQPLGQQFKNAEARRIVGAPDGDVLVIAEFAVDESTYAIWLGRVAGG